MNTHLEDLLKVVAEEHNGQPTLYYLHCQVLLSQEDPALNQPMPPPWILPDLSSLVLLLY